MAKMATREAYGKALAELAKEIKDSGTGCRFIRFHKNRRSEEGCT